MTEAGVDQLVQFIEELNNIVVGFDCDNDSGSVLLDFAYSALPNTQTAQALAAYTPSSSKYGGCMNEDAAIRFNATIEIPEALMSQQQDQMKAQAQGFRQQAGNWVDDEWGLSEADSETAKSALNDLIDVLEATSATGRLDMAGNIDISPNSFTLVAGGFAKETDKIESALKKLASIVESDPEFPGVNWEVDSHQGAKIHTMSVPIPENEAPPAVRQIFGGSLEIAVAIGGDQAFVVVGQDCVSILKTAMDNSGGGSTSVKAMQLTVALQPILATVAEVDPTGNPIPSTMSEALSSADEGSDEIHMTLESIKNQLRFRFELEKGVITSIGQATAAARRAGAF